LLSENCAVDVNVGGPANLAVNDLSAEKRKRLTLFALVSPVTYPYPYLPVLTRAVLGDLNFIIVDLLPGVVTKQYE